MAYRITDRSTQFGQSTTQKASTFLRVAAENIVNESTRKTPMKTGRLRMDVLKQVLGLHGSVVWGKNYAKYQEEKQFQNYTTPGTGPHFAENAVKKIVGQTQIIARSVGLI